MDMFPEMRFVLSLSDERKTIVMARKEKRSKHRLEYQLQIDLERLKSLPKNELKKMDLDLGVLSTDLNRQSFVLAGCASAFVQHKPPV